MQVIKPWHTYVKNCVRVLSDPARAALHQIKFLFFQAVVLARVVPGNKLYLMLDASTIDVGAVLQ